MDKRTKAIAEAIEGATAVAVRPQPLADAFLTRLRAAGYAVMPREPTQAALLLLGLLSGAGPQKRADYIEVWHGLVAAAEAPKPEETT